MFRKLAETDVRMARRLLVIANALSGFSTLSVHRYAGFSMEEVRHMRRQRQGDHAARL